jgi:invasion protein IalB
MALVFLGASGVGAQQSTTATYDDWVVQCQTEAASSQKNCDMAQVTLVQGKNAPFSRVAVEHPAKGHPVRLVVQVPVNVSLPSNVRLQGNDADPGVVAPFDRCLPAGCFADFDLKDDAVRKFRDASGAGKTTFKAADGHDVNVPVSFKGFGQAFDALSKE